MLKMKKLQDIFGMKNQKKSKSVDLKLIGFSREYEPAVFKSVVVQLGENNEY